MASSTQQINTAEILYRDYESLRVQYKQRQASAVPMSGKKEFKDAVIKCYAEASSYWNSNLGYAETRTIIKYPLAQQEEVRKVMAAFHAHFTAAMESFRQTMSAGLGDAYSALPPLSQPAVPKELSEEGRKDPLDFHDFASALPSSSQSAMPEKLSEEERKDFYAFYNFTKEEARERRWSRPITFLLQMESQEASVLLERLVASADQFKRVACELIKDPHYAYAGLIEPELILNYAVRAKGPYAERNLSSTLTLLRPVLESDRFLGHKYSVYTSLCQEAAQAKTLDRFKTILDRALNRS